MSWADKVHRERKEKKRCEKATLNALGYFFLLSVDYMHRELGFGEKRIKKYLHEISKFMGYISKDDEYFKLLNMELKRETGVDVLAEMGMEFEKE